MKLKKLYRYTYQDLENLMKESVLIGMSYESLLELSLNQARLDKLNAKYKNGTG